MSEKAPEQPAVAVRPFWNYLQAIRKDDGSYWPCLVFSNAQELLQHHITNDIIPTGRQREIQLAVIEQFLTPGSVRVALLLGATATPLLVWERAAPLHLQSFDEFLRNLVEPIAEDLKDALHIVQNYSGDPSAIVTLPKSATDAASATAENRTAIVVAIPDDERKMPAIVQLPDTVTQALTTSTARAVQGNKAVKNTKDASTIVSKDVAATTTATEPLELTKDSSAEVGDNDMELENGTAAAVGPAKLATKTPPKKKAKKNSPKLAKKAPHREPQLYGTDIAFDDVKAIFRKGGYKFAQKSFLIPKQGKFKTEQEFRTQLCRGYVACKCEGTKEVSGAKSTCSCWDSDELQKLELYTRFGILYDTDYRRQGHEPRLLTGVELNELMIRLGVKVENHSQYTFPGEPTEVGWEGVGLLGRPLDMKNQVARFHWPSCCDFSKISEEERFNLEFTIMQESRVNTFVKPEEKTSRKRRASMGSNTSPATVPKTAKRQKRASVDATSPLTRSSKKTPKKATGTKSAKKTLKSKVKSEADDATVISCASEHTASGKKSSSRRANKHNRDKLLYTARSQRSPATNHSPQLNRRAAIVSVSPGPSASRASIAPQDFDPSPRPVYTGTDCEKLRGCLDALSISQHCDSPSFCGNKTSQFKTNMEKIHGFLRTALVEKTSEDPSAQPSAIYVCGVPGIGKTSGVRWCCNLAQKANEELNVVVCEINAASLVSHSNPMENMYSAIGASLGLKSRKPIAIEKKLHNYGSKWNSTFLIVVVDEIESLVASEKLRGALRSLSTMSNTPYFQMALIGISNCMNDDKYDLIRENGQFKETITFRAYSESEIRDILYARVGDNMVCKPAVDIIAKKVSEGGGGDARRALEMAAYAVQLRLDQTEEHSISSGALVTFKDAMNASKASEGMQIGERVASLPPTGLAVLCVLTEFASAGFQKTTISDARSRANECLRVARQSDDVLPGADFLLTLEMIVDMGLLGASRGDKPSEINFSSREVSSVMHEEIYLQTPLEEVSKILETEVKLPFFQTVRHHARVLAKKKQEAK